ncbi:MAG: poly-beta-1,6-N-acetyl-D-glucosamine biosynthesis protein PgaD [Gemmatimonadales bacterium]|nr:MAG: poly-beta-1,6-N-acetyl-D-glucosamine biosynthesis protein PgaD [Gemmatimonadales bacterium]
MSRSTSPAARTDRSGSPLIVDQPELQRRPHRMLYSILTLIAWVIWVYLWLPLVTLLAWYFGLRVFLREIVIPDPATMLAVGLVYGLVVLILGGSLLVWSRYNVRRFRGKERREEVPPLSDQAVSEWFAVDPETLARFRSQGSLTVQLDEHGMVQSLEAEPVRS